MTYTTVSELPTEVRRAFSKEDAISWMKAYNQAMEKYDGEADGSFKAREEAWEACSHLPSSRYVKSNVSTEIVDRDGDVADVHEYVSAGQGFVEDGGQVTRNHSHRTIGTTWKVEEGVDARTGSPCVIAYTNFFRGKPLYEKGWKDFKSGRLKWSISSITRSTHECNSNICYNKLHPTQWFELSLVDFPRNPVTYDIETNETSKGDDSVIEMNEDEHVDEECPIMRKYNTFKDAMGGLGVEAHIVEGGVILLKGKLNDDACKIVNETYPDFYLYKGNSEEEDIALVIPQIDDSDEFLESMVDLIKDEQEAISGYHTVLDALARGHFMDMDGFEKTSKAFEEVIHDEENHIGVILEVIKTISPDMYSHIADGMRESADEASKGCPAGQHEHAGVVGCHDVFRKHELDYKTSPSNVLDLTDENIDVNAIKQIDTPKLKELVVRIAKALSHYGRDAIEEFMTKPAGKEFVLAYLELKNRQVQGEDDSMSEDEVQKASEDSKAPAEEPKEAEKGLLSDPQTSLANIASVLASLTNLMEGLDARLMRLESSLASQNENKEDISSAILSDVGEIGAKQEGAPAPPAVPDEEKVEEEKEVAPPVEVKTEVEEKEEDKPEDKPEEDKKEEPAEDKKEDESEEDKKEDKPEEDKKEESDDDKKDDEKEKGNHEVIQPEGETIVDPDGSPEVNIKGDDAGKEPAPEKAEPLKEEDKCGAPVVEEKGESVPWYPKPVGEDSVDFRSAILQRKAEAKSKGIEYNIGAQNNGGASLVDVPIIQVAKGSDTILVNPSNHIQMFDGGVQPAGSSMDVLKHMGEYDPKTFLSKLFGE